MTHITGSMTCGRCLMSGVESLVVPLDDAGICPRCGDESGWQRCAACQAFVHASDLDEAHGWCGDCQQDARRAGESLRAQSAYR